MLYGVYSREKDNFGRKKTEYNGKYGHAILHQWYDSKRTKRKY